MASTKLEKAITGLMDTFHEHSRKQKHYDKLNLEELTQYIKEEFPIFLSTCATDDPDGFIKGFFDKYKDKDGEVSFNDCMTIIGIIAKTYHNRSHNDMTCGDRR
ncbi:protein S100-A7 [Trichosurus vulpecula]|uniref:protein S100-A7 n=1 Tax=Trichosurus vulpecula TaxID=9337 RepID=UPI00186B2DAB|nr:protein S100-A7 [Trichosurus vulpecula]